MTSIFTGLNEEANTHLNTHPPEEASTHLNTHPPVPTAHATKEEEFFPETARKQRARTREKREAAVSVSVFGV